MLVCIGCRTRSHSPFNGLSAQESRALAQQLALRRDQELQADLRSAFSIHAPRNILILSGGDAHGAFGCGVLNGWRNAPAGRPKFDVVTGVSTGGLMATFAFLGEEQDDATLREVYTTIRDKDIYSVTFNGFQSVVGTGPLKRLIAKHVTAQTLRRVAAAHREGRRLYVTTVELESGAACIWPLSKIASDAVRPSFKSNLNDTARQAEGEDIDPAGLDRFRQVLLATAAVPVVFPPVEIDAALHFDPGLREAISLRLFMMGSKRTSESASYEAPGNDQANTPLAADSQPTVWAIVNGRLHSPPLAVRNNFLSFGTRSLELFNETVVILSLRDAAHVAATHEPPFQFR